MRQLLDSELELFVEADYVYLPLLLDPSIEKEAQALVGLQEDKWIAVQPHSAAILAHKNRRFIRTLSLFSLIENYAAINPYHCHLLRDDCLRKHRLAEDIESIFFDDMLEQILFQVMPYFVKNSRRLTRRSLNRDDVLDLIVQRIEIPEKFHADAVAFLDLEPFATLLRNLRDRRPVFEPAPRGLLPARKLYAWFQQAIQAKILADERIRVEKALRLRQQLSLKKPEHAAIYLYLAAGGTIEIEGFGFSKMKLPGDYLVYKRTGEYTLKDYYGRSYLFPDCRVAISTYAPLRPFVIEKYKHPFLRGFQVNQEICMKALDLPGESPAKTIVRALEEGVTALLYGYDARRRNGYHSLDKTYVYIPTIVFEEYRIDAM